MIEQSRDDSVGGPFDTDEFAEIVEPFTDESGTTLADRSLELLGIESSETEQYQYTDVSEVLA